MIQNTHRCHGLELVIDGVRWRWISYRILPGLVRRSQERIEQFESTCAACSRPFVVLSRLVGGHRQVFFERRNRGDADVRLPVRADLYPALRPTCRKCRTLVEQRPAGAEARAT